MSKMRLPLLLAGVFSLVAMTGVQAQTDRDKEVIERIKPVGEVCVQGKSNCAAPPVTAAAGPRSGEQVYSSACVACHAAGVAGAPKFGVATDWATRVAQGEDTLLQHAIAGIRAMPPRGTCMNCSDEELRFAVQYMVSNSK